MTGVTQGDREAAATYLERTRNMPCHYSDMREGSEDDHRLVQAFAAHRITALEEAAVEAIDATKTLDRKDLTAWGAGYLAACAEIECQIRNLKGAGA